MMHPPPLPPDGTTPPVGPGRFRLEFLADEPIAVGVKRVVLQEIDEAADALRHDPDRANAVHRARKAVKRLRSMLRLVRSGIGDVTYRAENAAMRDIARGLSPIRSAHVRSVTAQALVDDLGDALSEPAARHLTAELITADLDAAAALNDTQTMTGLLVGLDDLRERCDHGVFSPAALRRIPDAFATIEPGIRRVYRRGRTGMRRAIETPTIDTLHEWRKAVKYLQCQMEALHLLAPGPIGDLAETLSTLAETLGSEHDLAELAHLIETETWLVPHDHDRRSLGVEIGRRRLVLQGHAARIGERTFGARPKAFTARLEAHWMAARE